MAHWRHHGRAGAVPRPGFVGVGGHQHPCSLVLDGRPFYFAGANCHYLATRAVQEAQRPLVLDVLDAAVELDVTVIRAWAFCDGPEEWQAMQPEPGRYCEEALCGLDWLVAECARRGLRLLLALTNYWADYGGIPQYVRWCHNIPSQQEHDVVLHPPEEFYTNVRAQELFRGYVRHLLCRSNTVTGLPYRDDPCIMAWDVCNEPRCQGDPCCVTLKAWVADTAAFVRSLDPHHLITVGLEGFYGPSTPGLLRHNPYEGAEQHGADFAAVCSLAGLDFASCHLWLDQWRPLDQPEEQLRRFACDWLESHAALCGGGDGGAGGPALRMPLVLSEFGKREPASYHSAGCCWRLGRAEAFKEVLRCAAGLAKGGGAAEGGGRRGGGGPTHYGPLSGAMVWMLAARQYPDYDGYTLHVAAGEAAAGGSGCAPQPGGGASAASFMVRELYPAAPAGQAEQAGAPAAGSVAADGGERRHVEPALAELRAYGAVMRRLCQLEVEGAAAPGPGPLPAGLQGVDGGAAGADGPPPPQPMLERLLSAAIACVTCGGRAVPPMTS